VLGPWERTRFRDVLNKKVDDSWICISVAVSGVIKGRLATGKGQLLLLRDERSPNRNFICRRDCH